MDIAQTKSFNKNLIVGILLAAAFVTVLNQTLLVIAIPSLMTVFDIDANKAQWVTTAFLLTNGIMIPITAFLIEKYSNRMLFIIALSTFTIGTIIGAVAPTFTFVIIARIIQAIGAGIMMPLMQTIILTMYPPKKRGAAMGLVGLVIAFAPAIGPPLSGWVLDQFSWRYLFYILLPIGLIVLLFTIFFMKNVTEQRENNIDIRSVILSTFGWGGLLYGFSIVGSYGWGNSLVLISLMVGTISLILFITRQYRMERPMLEFRVFESKVFRITTILSVLVFAIMLGFQTLLPIYAQNVKEVSALNTGLVLLPGAIIMGIMSPITGRIFDKIGGRMLSIVGFSIILLSNILLVSLIIDTTMTMIVILFAMMMLGLSMIAMPLMTAGINALPKQLIAHGTAMSNTIRMVCGSIGTAVLVSVMSASSAITTTSAAKSEVLLGGLQTAFIVTTVMALAGVLLSFTLEKAKKADESEVMVKQVKAGS